jgi:hypothetical protein
MGYTGEKKRKYQREWSRKRREDWVKANGPCQTCGSNKRLEIDHIDYNIKSVHVSRIWSYTKSKREAELAKCQVLCHSCHKKKTAKEATERFTGTRSKLRKLSKDQFFSLMDDLYVKKLSQRKVEQLYPISRQTISHIALKMVYKDWVSEYWSQVDRVETNPC